MITRKSVKRLAIEIRTLTQAEKIKVKKQGIEKDIQCSIHSQMFAMFVANN